MDDSEAIPRQECISLIAYGKNNMDSKRCGEPQGAMRNLTGNEKDEA
jgi:hypothetical protein